MASSESVGMGSGAMGSTSAWNGEDVPRALGRYLLLKRIARGGMGEVFLASTTGIEGAERLVVAKIIRREHAKDPSFIARFLDEARVQAQLQHSGVAQVLDASIDDRTGEPYAVVEHVEGKSLGDVRARALQIGHAIGWADAVAIATLIAEALAHVHERLDASGKPLAIVHRDLSPQNVMVSYGGECKIIDFGTARGQNRRCHTVAGVVFAKPGYVAPEVANGDSGDARVDIYALGVMLWELCAGRRFLQGDAAAHMTAVSRNAKSLPPIAESVGAPVELDAILAMLTAFDRDARYLAARTAAADLARLLPMAPPLPGGERGVRARVASLMAPLFPGEPGKTRREFARLAAAARSAGVELRTPPRLGAAVSSAPSAPGVPGASAELPPPAREGDVLGGTRYRLVREIGRGAASLVYEAEHLDLSRRVAIKIIAEAPEIGARFRREARTLSRLSHEGLVAVLDVGQAADGRLFCVMELLEGETLERLLTREKGLGYREALGVARRVLAALEVAHGAALVHRDIKPANLFLPRSATASDAQRPPVQAVKVLDFGLARGVGELEGATPADIEKRAGFALFGTPEYMAPEQAAGAPVDARADLYALGCVLYEALTGQLPFAGASSVAVLDAKIKGNPERPRDRAPAREIPAAVDALVMKALARHPSQRFQTATEMRLAVEAVLASPARLRRSRLAGAFAVVAMAAIAMAAVASRNPRLRAAVPWLHGREAVAVAAAAPVPVAVASEAPAPVADAKAGEDGFDEGEDGDFADDTLPPAPAAEPAAPPAEPAAPPEKARHHRHKAKASASKAKSPDAAADKADDDAAKGKKPHHKHKIKVTDTL
jgi:eukaryotic-like serine/threonine-protein kinase